MLPNLVIFSAPFPFVNPKNPNSRYSSLSLICHFKWTSPVAIYHLTQVANYQLQVLIDLIYEKKLSFVVWSPDLLLSRLMSACSRRRLVTKVSSTVSEKYATRRKMPMACSSFLNDDKLQKRMNKIVGDFELSNL